MPKPDDFEFWPAKDPLPLPLDPMTVVNSDEYSAEVTCRVRFPTEIPFDKTYAEVSVGISHSWQFFVALRSTRNEAGQVENKLKVWGKHVMWFEDHGETGPGPEVPELGQMFRAEEEFRRAPYPIKGNINGEDFTVLWHFSSDFGHHLPNHFDRVWTQYDLSPDGSVLFTIVGTHQAENPPIHLNKMAIKPVIEYHKPAEQESQGSDSSMAPKPRTAMPGEKDDEGLLVGGTQNQSEQGSEPWVERPVLPANEVSLPAGGPPSDELPSVPGEGYPWRRQPDFLQQFDEWLDDRGCSIPAIFVLGGFALLCFLLIFVMAAAGIAFTDLFQHSPASSVPAPQTSVPSTSVPAPPGAAAPFATPECAPLNATPKNVIVCDFRAKFVLSQRSTIYTVMAYDQAGGTLHYSWTNSNPCGQFGAADSAEVTWAHPDSGKRGACPNEPVHGGTITVVITSDATSAQVTCTYPGGSASGTSTQCTEK